MDGPAPVRGARVGVLPGSFNPPTIAHLELARAARRQVELDAVVFSLSSVIVDKERVEGLCREDRLLLLSLLTADDAGAAVAVVNRGLYSAQAPAFRTCLGGDLELWFIVGMDKVLQIFDPRYYRDRGAALDALFVEARLIAANRGAWGARALRILLDRPENLPYRNRVRPLTLPARLRHQSSSAVRRGVEGRGPRNGAAAPAVRAFMAAAGAYREPYEWRRAALDTLYAVRPWAETEVALEVLLAMAAEPGGAGAVARRALRSPMPPEALKARLRSLGVTRTPPRAVLPD